MPNKLVKILTTTFLSAAIGLGWGVLEVKVNREKNKELLEKASRIIVEKGTPLIHSRDNYFETKVRLNLKNIIFSVEKDNILVKTTKTVKSAEGLYFRQRVLFDYGKNGTIDEARENSYFFPNQGEAKINKYILIYLGVDLLPYTIHQTEYLRLLRLLSQRRLSEIEKLYQNEGLTQEKEHTPQPRHWVNLASL